MGKEGGKAIKALSRKEETVCVSVLAQGSLKMDWDKMEN